MSIKVCKVNYLFIVYFIYIPSTLMGVSVPFIWDTYKDRNCSWEFEDADSFYQRRTQQCEVRPYETTGNIGGACENPFPDPDMIIDRAVPVNDMKIEEITRYITFTGSTDMDGNYTCIRITYTIDRGVTEKISGIQFSLQGKGLPDLSKHFCQNHVYDNGIGLAYYSVVHARTCTVRECDLRIFVYDQFCGIVPGLPYEVGVRTLPVDYTSSNALDYDTIERLRYPDNLTYSGSNCTTKPNDMRCRLNDEAKWTSNSVEVLADNSWNVPDSVNVTLKFALAPKDFRFVRYKVFLYKIPKTLEGDCEGDRSNRYTDIQLPRIDHDRSDITLEFKDVDTSSCYQYKIIPLPDRPSPCKIGIEQRDEPCSSTYSDIFNPTANPCSTNPCGENGKCRSPNGKDYTCICNVGFETYNGTCLRNPCFNETGNQNKDLCGKFSLCNVTFAGKNGHLKYRCVCDPGYYMNVVNNTCILLIQTSGIDTSMNYTTMTTGAIIAGVIGGALLLIALIILGLYKKRNFGKTKGTDQQPPAVLNGNLGHVDVPHHWFVQAKRHSGTEETESQFSEHFKSVNEDPSIIPMDSFDEQCLSMLGSPTCGEEFKRNDPRKYLPPGYNDDIVEIGGDYAGPDDCGYVGDGGYAVGNGDVGRVNNFANTTGVGVYPNPSIGVAGYNNGYTSIHAGAHSGIGSNTHKLHETQRQEGYKPNESLLATSGANTSEDDSNYHTLTNSDRRPAMHTKIGMVESDQPETLLNSLDMVLHSADQAEVDSVPYSDIKIGVNLNT